MLYGIFAIPNGDAGTFATLGYMAQLATAGATEPVIRNTAARIVQGTENDPISRAQAIANYIARVTEFLPDPVHAEALIPPADALALVQAFGVAQMDCDDVAMLAAALGMSIGLAADFVVVDFGQGYAHVWADLIDPASGERLTIDPTRPTVGLPSVTRSAVYEVR